jgi:hypothetical protein
MRQMYAGAMASYGSRPAPAGYDPWHGDGPVRVQGERGPQVLDGPLRPLRHPDRRQPAGVYPWLITLEGRSVRKGVAPNRDKAAAAVSDALDELSD